MTEHQTASDRAVAFTKACDACKKKKRRCIMTEDRCTQCTKYDLTCTFSPPKVKKGPRRPPGYMHVEKLEARLQTMEVMLQNSLQNRPTASNVEGEQFGDLVVPIGYDGSHAHTTPLDLHRIAKRKVIQKRRVSIGSKPRNISSLTTRPEKQTLISHPEAHSPSGNVLQEKSLHWPLKGAYSTSLDRESQSLPPRDKAQHLIQETFTSFNSAFPIFDPVAFQKAFDTSYDDVNHDNPAWWACVNVVFAFGHRFRAMKNGNIQTEDAHCWRYLQNALSFVPEISLLSNDLMTVQALLGITILLQGTPNSEPCSILISMAVRLAQGMNMHRQKHQIDIGPADMEQRNRVFWLVCIYDKDISLRTHNPPAQDDDDMDVDLPIETTDLSHDHLEEINFYNNHIGMSIIQGQIYKRLLSTRAQKTSDIDRMLVAKELVSTLKAWKQSIPCMLSIEDFNSVHGTPSFFILLHRTILKFTYFYALDTIRRQARTEEIDGICLVQARESLQLLQQLPQGNFAYVWLLLDWIISACNVILSNESPSMLKDLELVNGVLALLDLLKGTSKALDVGKMAEDLQCRVQEVVANRKENRIEEGSGTGNKKIRSMQDFVERIQELSSKRCAEFRATGVRSSRDE